MAENVVTQKGHSVTDLIAGVTPAMDAYVTAAPASYVTLRDVCRKKEADSVLAFMLLNVHGGGMTY